MDPVLECAWRDDHGWWWLQVQRSGDGWELEAGSPHCSETIPFADPDEVRRLARTLLALPAEPEPYEAEWELSGPEIGVAGRRQPTGATLHVGLSRQEGHRPYLAYQSYYTTSLGPALGLEVFCENAPLADLRPQAQALLTLLQDS
ncbi:hypothetical protein ABTZ03_30080 [Kitasatospora sp. NPDC096077]|uniref:hypothetical protein n=1 Tax=Kitasatospora sp. NPDC096077 TaxID=3155544 RepID=UPI003334690A